MLQGDLGKLYSLKAVYRKSLRMAQVTRCPCSKHGKHGVDRNLREAEARQC